MDNVGIVVENLDPAIEFFTELGLTLEGRTRIEGEWSGRTPDGHSRLELSRFDAPTIASDHRIAPVNSLGYLRVMFAVTDIDDALTRLSRLGATVVDEVVNYENIYRLCYSEAPKEFSSDSPNRLASRPDGRTLRSKKVECSGHRDGQILTAGSRPGLGPQARRSLGHAAWLVPFGP